MGLSLLNLISTPVTVLNTLGLNLRVGLSSEDPTVVHYPSESYEAYLTVYSPEGVLLDRTHLGDIPPRRRRYFDISSITRELVPELDHLAVVHRIPTRLVAQVSNVEDELELPEAPEYPMFRALVEYSYPQGGNGSLIYETPYRLNAATGEGRSSNTLTFTCQTLLSDVVNTYVLLIHYSMNPSYSKIATYDFALHSLSGERLLSDRVAIAPFSVNVLDLAKIVPKKIVNQEKDPQDGLSSFTFLGYSEDAAILGVVVNAAPSVRAVSVEHTHPPQGYLFPHDPGHRNRVKTDAQRDWRSIISPGRNK